MNATGTRRFLPWLLVIVLALLVWGVFGQTLRFGFVNYDDPEWVSENPHVTNGLTSGGMQWAFSRFHAGPLSSISHMLDFQLFGPAPWGHHLSNVLLHLAAAVLLFFALNQMTGAIWRSFIVTALFAIHPLRAESVAWVTERKDVLSGLFFGLTLLLYARYARRRSILLFFGLAVSFSLGLLAKGSLVTLPFVLLLLDYWPANRMALVGRDSVEPLSRCPSSTESRPTNAQSMSLLLLEKLPLLALSGACALATFWTHAGAAASVQPVSPGDRLSAAVVGVFIYLRQMVLPTELSPFYGPKSYSSAEVAALAALSLIVISIAAVAGRKRFPYLFVGWFWFLIMLLPVSGIVQVALQSHADRYTYLPQIGLFIAVVWWMTELASVSIPIRRTIIVLAACLVLACACIAHRATAAWRDTETLWRRAIEVDPSNDFARTSLTDYMLRQNRINEAISQSEQAVRSNPNNAEAHNDLALGLSRKGRMKEAIEHWEKSLALHAGNLNARCNLAWVLSASPAASQEDGARAIALVEPIAAGAGESNTLVWQILGAAYARNGRFEDAIAVAQRGRKMAERQANSAMVQQFDVSIAHYQRNEPLSDDSLVDRKSTPPPLLVRPR